MCQSSFREILDQAQGQAVHNYMATHQDRSRNALAKSVQAAFNSWCEDLKADQAQFVSEKLLWPGSGRCAGSYPSSTKRQLTVIKLQFFQWSTMIKFHQWFLPQLRAEKEAAKVRTKLVQQLEDQLSCANHTDPTIQLRIYLGMSQNRGSPNFLFSNT